MAEFNGVLFCGLFMILVSQLGMSLLCWRERGRRIKLTGDLCQLGEQYDVVLSESQIAQKELTIARNDLQAVSRDLKQVVEIKEKLKEQVQELEDEREAVRQKHTKQLNEMQKVIAEKRQRIDALAIDSGILKKLLSGQGEAAREAIEKLQRMLPIKAESKTITQFKL